MLALRCYTYADDFSLLPYYARIFSPRHYAIRFRFTLSLFSHIFAAYAFLPR